MQQSEEKNNETGFHIYNVTTRVEHGIHERWLEWMKKEHIPGVMHTGCFIRFRLVRLLETDETDGVTYATQYYARHRADYELYIHHFALLLQKEKMARWGNDLIEFSSLMQVVH
jgi:hypothetical protein